MAELQHEPELIERLARVNEGNARAHIKLAETEYRSREVPKAWSRHEMIAASGFVISASLWSLIDPLRAVKGFREASELYRRMRHSYWLVLGLVSANRNEMPRMLSIVSDISHPDPQIVAFGLVCNALTNAGRTDSLQAQWRHLGNVPVGRLGIPLDHYGQFADAMRVARETKNLSRFQKAASDYLDRAAEVIRTASYDRFHWRRLQSPVLPAEPEAIAMTRTMSMMSQSLFQLPMTEISNLDIHGRLLVEVGEKMQTIANE